MVSRSQVSARHVSRRLESLFSIAAGDNANLPYPDVSAGPIVVSSDNSAQIIATLYELKRPASTGLCIGWTTMMGLPWSWLADTYIIPRYNHIPQDILPYVVFGIP